MYLKLFRSTWLNLLYLTEIKCQKDHSALPFQTKSCVDTLVLMKKHAKLNLEIHLDKKELYLLYFHKIRKVWPNTSPKSLPKSHSFWLALKTKDSCCYPQGRNHRRPLLDKPLWTWFWPYKIHFDSSWEFRTSF